MTKEDIIRMAREAGLHLATDVHWMPIIGLEYAEKFATLVAAAERERLASKFMEMHNGQQHRNNYFAFAARVIREEA